MAQALPGVSAVNRVDAVANGAEATLELELADGADPQEFLAAAVRCRRKDFAFRKKRAQRSMTFSLNLLAMRRTLTSWMRPQGRQQSGNRFC